VLGINDDELLWLGLGSIRTSPRLLPPSSHLLRDSHPYLKLGGKFKGVCHILHANILEG
jgi:hypothetical protein